MFSLETVETHVYEYEFEDLYWIKFTCKPKS
jgi:hypothetical protein